MSGHALLREGLEAVMAHSAEPLVLCDPHLEDMPLISVNAAFEALCGYPASEIVGRNCRFLQGPKTDREIVARIGQNVRAGVGCVQWIENYRRDGSRFWNLLFISPIHDSAGRLRYFFANQHDLSAERPLELDEFVLGSAHMPEESAAAFRSLLMTIGADQRALAGADTAAMRASALASVLAGAREAARRSVRLAAGPG